MGKRIHYLRLATCVLAAILAQGQSVQGQPSQQPQEHPKLLSKAEGLSFDSLTFAPQSRATPAGILTIRCAVSNPGSRTAIGYLVGRIDGQIGEEDRRRINLAGGEHKSVDIQIRLPKKLPEKPIDVTMTLNVMEDDREILVQNRDEPITRTLRLPIVKDHAITAIRMNDEPIEQVYWRWPPTQPFTTYEFVVATRLDASLSRSCVSLDHTPFPLNIADWNCLNTLVVATPKALEDAASMGMMQQFLQSGGRIWIMLDHIDTDLVRELLADDQQLETVDKVELNRLELVVADHRFDVAERSIESDQAMSMKRVIQHGGKITHSVDGWPVAIWMPVGRGELLFTTLESSAWIIGRAKQSSKDPLFHATYAIPQWANTFAQHVHIPKPLPPLNLDKTTYPVDLIGNPVVSRSLVSFVLLSFCGCLIAMGLWRSAGRQLRWLGVTVPLLALAASVPLFAAAIFQRREIPSMVSALQMVQMDSRSGTIVRESAAVYTNEVSSMELIGNGDGSARPSDKIETGIRSITTEGFQKWRMTNPVWPTGTWRYRSELALPDQTALATSQLTEDGLLIELPKELGTPLEDIVIAMEPGGASLAKSLDGTRRILVDGELPAEGERWTTDTIVTDEQRRRATVYRELFEDKEFNWIPPRTVCGWSPLWKQTPQWNADLERRGAAMVTLPLRVAVPEVGTKVRIPFGMIRTEYSNSASPSVIFHQATGRFISESRLTTQTDLAFLLPQEAVPLEVTSIKIDWDVQAPKRTARLSCWIGGEEVQVALLNEPSIPYISTIRDPRILKDMEDGRLEMRINIIGDEVQLDQAGFITWQIKHLRLTVEGRTLPRNRLVKNPVP
ncbi:MAG: hypothetical protein ABL921_15030 [Pirellula sp.]